MNWRKYFASWIAVKNIAAIQHDCPTADVVRVVRIHKTFFYFHHNWLSGFVKDGTVRWMKKGSWMNPNSDIVKALNKEWGEFRASGLTDFNEFRQKRSTQELMESLEK